MLISAQVFITPLVSLSIVLRHVFFGLPLLRFPWGFHSGACLVISSIGFRSVWPSHPHLRFLICKSILGCFVCFHSSLFVIWSGQKILNVFLKLLLIKTIPNMYVHINSTLMGRHNHLICPLGSCHAFPASLLVPHLELPT